MAMNSVTLSNKLFTDLSGLGVVLDSVKLKQFCDIIAQDVVDHIKNNAVVSTTTLGTIGVDTLPGQGTVA